MATGRAEGESEYETVRGEPVATIDNLIRWERVKLREAAQEAVELLESTAQPTREYLDYMFTTDVRLRELRTRIAKYRERVAELEAMRTEARTSV